MIKNLDMDQFQINLDDVKESFEEVGGLTTAINEIMDLVTGIQPKAAIMLGPPGIGKSIIARAANKEVGILLLSFTFLDGS